MKSKKITLCGSAQFEAQSHLWNKLLSLSGHIVHGMSYYPSLEGSKEGYTPEMEKTLDNVHMEKIAVSEAIVVLNVGGYIGKSTKRAIRRAQTTGKEIYFLERNRMHTQYTSPISLLTEEYSKLLNELIPPLRTYNISIEYDHDPINPIHESEWVMCSFNPKHMNYRHPDEFFTKVYSNKAPTWKLPYLSKAKNNLAFTLSCYAHSGEIWGLYGEVPSCRFDTSNIAGVLIWTGKPADCGPTEEREAYARSIMKEYTHYANGQILAYRIEDEEEDVLDSCGGFDYDDTGYMAEHIAEALVCSHLSSIYADRQIHWKLLNNDGAEFPNSLLDEQIAELLTQKQQS